MNDENALIVDCHNHLTDDFDIDGADEYFLELEKFGVRRVMVCAISHTRWGGNQATLDLKRRYPERISVFAYIDVDRDRVDDIWKYKEQGFSGLKVIQTEERYDDQKYMKYYPKIPA